MSVRRSWVIPLDDETNVAVTEAGYRTLLAMAATRDGSVWFQVKTGRSAWRGRSVPRATAQALEAEGLVELHDDSGSGTYARLTPRGKVVATNARRAARRRPRQRLG